MAKRKIVSATILMFDKRGRIVQACRVRANEEGGAICLGRWEGCEDDGSKAVFGVEIDGRRKNGRDLPLIVEKIL